MADDAEEQQFCLRWNNFQSNITTQFSSLRDNEDFVDVTLACEGQRLQAHKVVLSACSPFFKELFKSNPCPHPIIFMRDVEAQHIMALLEFMYAGEVKVAQAHLGGFLKTAESLQIRGLTDASKAPKNVNKSNKSNEFDRVDNPYDKKSQDEDPLKSNSTGLTNEPSTAAFDKQKKCESPPTRSRSSSISSDDTQTVREKQARPAPQSTLSPPSKRICKTENVVLSNETENVSPRYDTSTSPSSTNHSNLNSLYKRHTSLHSEIDLELLEPKTEPDYHSDDENFHDINQLNESTLEFDNSEIGSHLQGNMDLLPGTSTVDLSQDSSRVLSDSRKLHSLDPHPCSICARVYSNLSNLRQHMRLIHHPQTVTCPICGKQFKTTLYMKRHLIIYHNVESSQMAALSSATSDETSANSVPSHQSVNSSIYSLKNASNFDEIHVTYGNETTCTKVGQDVGNFNDSYGTVNSGNVIFTDQKENILLEQL